MQPRVTLRQIAEKAGTSIGTVDRALNNRTGISATRRQEILALAEEMGYRPNRFASVLRKQHSLHLGISYPIIMQDFYNHVDAGVDAAAEELADYGVTVEKIRYQTQEPERAYEHLSRIDPTRFDGLAINSPGGRIAGLIDRFVDSGTPIITFNNDSPESQRLFYVGSDPREAGMMGGELMSMLLGGRGNVTVLGNFSRTTPFVERFGGFCEFLQPAFPEIHLYPCSECNNYTEVAARSLMDLIERVPDINGVFCAGFTATVGAVGALKEMRRKDIVLIGFDAAQSTLRALEEQWCRALLFQDPYKQGYLAIHLLARHLLEGWMPDKRRLYVENRVVLRTNAHRYEEPSVYTKAFL